MRWVRALTPMIERWGFGRRASNHERLRAWAGSGEIVWRAIRAGGRGARLRRIVSLAPAYANALAAGEAHWRRRERRLGAPAATQFARPAHCVEPPCAMLRSRSLEDEVKLTGSHDHLLTLEAARDSMLDAEPPALDHRSERANPAHRPRRQDAPVGLGVEASYRHAPGPVDGKLDSVGLKLHRGSPRSSIVAMRSGSRRSTGNGPSRH